MLNLAEYRQRPALLADWLPWAGLVAPGVVLNKDGSFQRTARFRGPDLDSATQGELIATAARLNNALRRLGSGWALFIEAERRAAADYPHSEFPEPLSWLVDEERRATFEDSGNHFESGYHLTLVYLPPEESRARVLAVLGGEPGPSQDVVLLNAAAALSVSGIVPSLWDGVALARDTITSGAAKAKLDQLVAFTQAFAKAGA